MITAEALRAELGADVRAVTLASHGRDETYDAVPLIKVLELVGVQKGSGRNAEVGMAVVARARDGYVVVFGLGELMANTGAKDVFLAFGRAGTPLPVDQGPMRLVVPSDKRGARSVFGVIAIELRDLGVAQ